jgi:DNA invertase Pin-like site-specific DNA recombinase
MISARTKAALAAAKARGKKLGGQRRKVIGTDAKGRKVYGEPLVISRKARTLGSAALQAREDSRVADVGRAIKSLQDAGATSLRAIAAGLNDQGIPTARGNGQWSIVQVARVLERI